MTCMTASYTARCLEAAAECTHHTCALLYAHLQALLELLAGLQAGWQTNGPWLCRHAVCLKLGCACGAPRAGCLGLQGALGCTTAVSRLQEPQVTAC